MALPQNLAFWFRITTGSSMNRLLFSLAGAAIFFAVSYGLVELFALWYGPRYLKSDSDIGDAFMAALGFMAVCLIGGAIVGYRWAVAQRGIEAR